MISIIIPLLLSIINYAGASLVPALTGASFVLIILINILVPLIFIPCFYTYSDLDESKAALK